MEKIMIKRHREQRTSIKADRENKKSHHKIDKSVVDEKVLDKNENHCHHGMKRSGSDSWGGDSHKVFKCQHQPNTISNNGNVKTPNAFNTIRNSNIPPPNTVTTELLNSDVSSTQVNDANLWPPFSVILTTMNNTQPSVVTSANKTNDSFATGVFPVYYVPTQQQPIQPDPRLGAGFQVQYMPGMIYNYNTLVPASPIFCPAVSMMPVPLAQPISPINPEKINPVPTANVSKEHKLSPPRARSVPQFQRPASQATSVKAEPGSAMSSIGSASIANKAMSECSRIDLCLQFVCSPYSPLVSPPGDETGMENFNINSKRMEKNDVKNLPDSKYQDSPGIDEESSYSSFYSSFLKTDTGSGSNEDSNNTENKISKNNDRLCQKSTYHSIHKRDPSWLEAVSFTPELIYRYQMSVKGLEDILESDLTTLKDMHQPMLVNDQLNQLYVEMELEGLSTKLSLEEDLTSSSSCDETNLHISKLKKKRRSYSSLMKIFEENAPFPPPDH